VGAIKDEKVGLAFRVREGQVWEPERMKKPPPLRLAFRAREGGRVWWEHKKPYQLAIQAREGKGVWWGLQSERKWNLDTKNMLVKKPKERYKKTRTYGPKTVDRHLGLLCVSQALSS
jgi:hypothetical protein